MSTVTLTFNLPEEETEARCAQQGADVLTVLNEIDEVMRRIVKYDEHPEVVKDAVTGLRTTLRELCEEYNVSMD
jgi:hypothetical protein